MDIKTLLISNWIYIVAASIFLLAVGIFNTLLLFKNRVNMTTLVPLNTFLVGIGSVMLLLFMGMLIDDINELYSPFVLYIPFALGMLLLVQIIKIVLLKRKDNNANNP